MGEHTPEPWFINADNGTHVIRAGGDKAVTFASHSTFAANPKEGAANARRIVACVNACAGIETDILEKIDDNAGILRAADTVASEITKRLQAEARADAAEALLKRSADLINHPWKAGPKWATYRRESVGSFIDALKEYFDAHKTETAPKPVRLGDEGEGTHQ